MKMTKTIILAAVALFSLSCSRDNFSEATGSNDSDVNLVPMTFSALSPVTKTAIADNGRSVNWVKDDKIAVIDDVQGDPIEFCLTSEPGSTSATFSGTVPDDATTFYAIYPYSPTVSCIDGYFSELNIEQDQTSTAGNISAGVMVAKADESNSLAFQNVNAVLKFSVRKEDNITRIAIRGKGKENIAGTLEFIYDGEIVVDETKLNATEIYVGNNNDVLAGTYYIMIAPVALSGIEIEMWNSDGNDASLSGGAITLKSGDLIELGTLSPTFQTEDFSGIYVLAVIKDKKYYAMSSSPYNKTSRRDNVEFTYSNPYNGTDESIVWTLEKTAGGYYLRTSASDYAAYGNNSLPVGQTKTVFSIEKESDVFHFLYMDGTELRQLAMNSNIGFGMYKSTSLSSSYAYDFYLIPVTTLPSLSAPTNVLAFVDESVSNKINVSWDAVENAGSYSVACGANVKTVTETTCSFETLGYNKEYTIKVIALPADSKAYLQSAPAEVNVTTGANPAGEEKKTYTLTFPDDNKAKNKVSSYSQTWEAVIGENSWSISNFNNNNWNNNWTYIKAGSKSAASVASISTGWAIDEAITQLTLDIKVTAASDVNSISWVIASDSDFKNVIETIAVKAETATCVSTVTKPTAKCYYKLVVDCKKGSDKNGFVQINSIKYSNE